MELVKPPFTEETVLHSVQIAENLWNNKDIRSILSCFAIDGFYFRYRGKIITNRRELESNLEIKWQRELDYVIEKNVTLFSENKIAVQFMYEWRTANFEYFRTYGNEFWEVNLKGQIIYHTISSNDVPIDKALLELV